MNEYIFFDANLRDRFLAFVATHGLTGQARPDPMGHLLVALPDDLDDEFDDAVEAFYAELMDEQRGLIDQSEPDSAYDAVGIHIELASGPRQIRLPPDIARVLYQHLSTEEIHELVTAIAQSVEDANDAPLCQR